MFLYHFDYRKSRRVLVGVCFSYHVSNRIGKNLDVEYCDCSSTFEIEPEPWPGSAAIGILAYLQMHKF